MSIETMATTAVEEHSIPEQYELLLSKLVEAERALDVGGPEANMIGLGDFGAGSQMAQSSYLSYLEEASAVVFDLLYSLDFKNGGELVPRLAALYGYIANELLTISRTGNRHNLHDVYEMIATLRQSWYGTKHVS